jgi:deoxyribonuclease V
VHVEQVADAITGRDSRPEPGGQYATVPPPHQEVLEEQAALAAATPPPWRLLPGAVVGGCFICFERGRSGPGRRGDPGWAAAAVEETTTAVAGKAGAPYEPGLLVLREGALLEAAAKALPRRPDVLLVNATGRDHPRRAGLALHLGAILGLPTVGVTHRTLVASGDWPDDERGAMAQLMLAGDLVGYWVRTKRGCRPLAVHAAWRTDAQTGVEAVLASVQAARTPEPLRRARAAARVARAAGGA